MPEDRVPHESPEVDSRFILANERTYLAYIRTSLALMAVGAALGNVHLFPDRAATRVIGALLLLVGVAVAVAGYVRWHSNDDRLRSGRPLDHTRFPLALVMALAALGLFLAVFAVV